ncbi:MAG: protoheme IX farnesyltransferase [Mariniphaga sp.]|nr:protoheme IX farnesyltransferase [Mariniphaga sp.]
MSVIIRLTRIRLSLMVSISAMTGYFLTGSSPTWSLMLMFGGVFFLAAGTSVLNQVQECRRDALMKRTAKRPIPAGEISRPVASLISILLIAGGTVMLSLNGWIPMALGLSNIVFYNLIYTPLKSRSWLAIIPGALVGAVPPLIGWTSAGFYIFHPNAQFVSIFVFLWQIPHFWLLMIKYGKEYESAGFSSISKMLNEHQIKLVVFYWGVITSLFLMLFPFFGFSFKPLLLGFLIGINFLFVSLFHRYLFRDRSSKTIRKAFILINTYAMVIFLFLVINAFLS